MIPGVLHDLLQHENRLRKSIILHADVRFTLSLKVTEKVNYLPNFNAARIKSVNLKILVFAFQTNANVKRWSGF